MNAYPISGYLVIKGISDVSDKPRSHEGQSNQEVRDAWRPFASHISAVFARELISSFKPNPHSVRPLPLERLAPPTLHINRAATAGVLYDVQPERYSELADYNVSRFRDNCTDGPLFFTVCAFTPQKLWKTVEESYHTERRTTRKRKREVADYETIHSWAQEHFPHFDTFSNLAKTYRDQGKPMQCVRILLLEDLENWTEGLTKLQWDLFMSLNGSVECWGASRDMIRKRSVFLTDYVVIGGRLVLDYYDDSSILVVTDVKHSSLDRHFLSLRKLFDKLHKNRMYFRPLEDLDRTAKSVFQN